MKNSPETLKKRNLLKRSWKRKINLWSFDHHVLKKCKDCHKVRLCKWLSSFTQTGRPEYRARCNKCHLLQARKWRRKGQKRISAQCKVRRLARKLKCVEYLGGNCNKCGYNACSRALTFHHRDGSEKYRDVSQMIDWGWKKVSEELDKCILLCFNCHMEEHSD